MPDKRLTDPHDLSDPAINAEPGCSTDRKLAVGFVEGRVVIQGTVFSSGVPTDVMMVKTA